MVSHHVLLYFRTQALVQIKMIQVHEKCVKYSKILTEIAPELEVEGGIRADAALDKIFVILHSQFTLQRFCKFIDYAELRSRPTSRLTC